MTQPATPKAPPPAAPDPPATQPTSETRMVVSRAATMESYERGLEPHDLADAYKLATILAESGLVGLKGPSDALARIMAGREIGLTAMQSIMGIYTFDSTKGRTIGVYAEVLEALCVQHPDCVGWEWTERSDERAILVVTRKGRKPQTFEFGKADAIRAQLWDKDNYQHHPRRMFVARCRGEAASTMFPDATRGFKSREEIEPIEVEGVVTQIADGILAQPPPTKEQLEAQQHRVDLIKTAIEKATTKEARKAIRAEIESAERSGELSGHFLSEAKSAFNASPLPGKDAAK